MGVHVGVTGGGLRGHGSKLLRIMTTKTILLLPLSLEKYKYERLPGIKP